MISDIHASKLGVKAALTMLRQAMPEMLEHAQLMMKIKREAYLGARSEGFTEAEALELAKGFMG